MQRVCCKPLLMGDRSNLFSTCQRKQNMIKETSTSSESLQNQSEQDGRMTLDLFGDYFEEF